MEDSEKIKEEIFEKIKQFHQTKQQKFIPGQTEIWCFGAVIDEAESLAVTDTILKGWLGLGSSGLKFERHLKEMVGGKACFLTNSGSSANLLAISAFSKIAKDKKEV